MQGFGVASKSCQRFRALESEATELEESPKMHQRRGAGVDTAAPTGGVQIRSFHHCCWTWGVVVIRTVANKASPNWMEGPLPSSSAGMDRVLSLPDDITRD